MDDRKIFEEKERVLKESEDKADNLEKLITENGILSYNPTCVRKRSNWGQGSPIYKFDDERFQPQTFLKDMPDSSPKLDALMKNIENLDRQDKQKYGKLFKHFIFSDLKSSTYGAKLIASAFMAKGYNLSYTAGSTKISSAVASPVPSLKKDTKSPEEEEDDDEFPVGELEELDEKKPKMSVKEINERDLKANFTAEESIKGGKGSKKYQKITLIDDEVLIKTKQNNFYILSSVGVYDQPINVSMKKDMLKKFNQRPENIHGELVRFIILDSGFKEGIDLFDIKYIHIFEPSTVPSDQKQVIGRGTRTCGQKGLEFHPHQGWPLHVFVYDLKIPESLQGSFMGAKTTMDLYLKAMDLDMKLLNFSHDLERTTVVGAVDYELNKNVHSFSIPFVSVNDDEEHHRAVINEHVKDDVEVLYGGREPTVPLRPLPFNKNGGTNQEIPKKRKLVIRQDNIEREGSQGQSSKAAQPGAPQAPLGNRRFPAKMVIRQGSPIVINNSNKQDKQKLGHLEMAAYIRQNFGEFAWDPVKMENLCADNSAKKGGAGQGSNNPTTKFIGGLRPPENFGGELIKYTPTQDFVRHYFTPMNPLKGMLLFQSVGTGKTCSAIAAATQNFEKNGYTILWVTRTTLKNDIWKNMFDQVCNESIRHQIEKSHLQMPTDQQKRMRLLSKAWRIRPMSYKQFSNLVSKQNALYDELVKINGHEDPLRKTLLIIDEAHKLYGGDDLSSLERPDMNALHQALMYSYQFSGADSVKVLLMTATPITKDPMELIQLFNLLKPADEQMPADFSNFSTKYLKENGDFTEHGRSQYLDDIAGYISYLNREKDARQFSQPQIHHIETPIIRDIKTAERFDKKLVQNMLDTNVSDLKQQIQEETKKLEGELGETNAQTFAFLKDDICGDLEGRPKTQCVKVVNNNIREMVAIAKEQVQHIRDKIKEIRERIKERGQMKKTAFAEVKQNIEKYGDQYERYQGSLLYQLRKKCAVKVGDKTTLDENIHEHPVIHKYDLAIDEYNKEIAELHEQLKNLTVNYKKRMEHLKHMLKTDLNEQERSVIHMTLRDEKKEYSAMIRLKKSENNQSEKILKESINNAEKKRTRRYNKIRKTVKNMIGNERERMKQINQEKKMLRKTLKDQKKGVEHDFLKNLVNKYRSKIVEDLVRGQEHVISKTKSKEEERERRELDKRHKKQMKEQEQMRKRETKKREQEDKKLQRELTKKNRK